MTLKFDSAFEGKKLEQIRTQCLKGKSISGTVIFACIGEDNSVSTSVWHFPDNDFHTLKETEYVTFCSDLLSVFCAYRSQFEGLEYRGGILSLEGKVSSIKWLSESEAMKLVEPH